MGNLKNSIKSFKVESKEIQVSSFEDTVTVYPICGIGLLKVKDLSEKMTNLMNSIDKIDASIETLESVDSAILSKNLDDINKLNLTKDSLQKELIEIQKDLLTFTLKYGCKADDDDIEYMFTNNLVDGLQLVKEIINYSSEYSNNKVNESSFAKKKLKK